MEVFNKNFWHTSLRVMKKCLKNHSSYSHTRMQKSSSLISDFAKKQNKNMCSFRILKPQQRLPMTAVLLWQRQVLRPFSLRLQSSCKENDYVPLTSCRMTMWSYTALWYRPSVRTPTKCALRSALSNVGCEDPTPYSCYRLNLSPSDNWNAAAFWKFCNRGNFEGKWRFPEQNVNSLVQNK